MLIILITIYCIISILISIPCWRHPRVVDLLVYWLLYTDFQYIDYQYIYNILIIIYWLSLYLLYIIIISILISVPCWLTWAWRPRRTHTSPVSPPSEACRCRLKRGRGTAGRLSGRNMFAGAAMMTAFVTGPEYTQEVMSEDCGQCPTLATETRSISANIQCATHDNFNYWCICWFYFWFIDY